MPEEFHHSCDPSRACPEFKRDMRSDLSIWHNFKAETWHVEIKELTLADFEFQMTEYQVPLLGHQFLKIRSVGFPELT